MKDLLLDKDGDLYLTPNGDISLTDSVRQAILIRLRWFLGEWIFNSQILIKNPSTAVIEQLFRQQILSVAEVIRIDNLSVQIDKRLRKCRVKFKAQTTQGAIEEEVQIDEL